MNNKYIPTRMLSVVSLCLASTANAGILPPTFAFELYECQGGDWSAGYTADVALTDDWEGYVFQLEDDVDGDCKDNKADGFACSGGGNLITSRIDDAVTMYAFANSQASESLVAGDPTGGFAVVHADIFQPGSCAESYLCNDDGDDGTTPEVDCYESGFGGGPNADGSFLSAEESCADTAANNGEAMFAEGIPFSENRPKNGGNRHKNWAMFVELDGACTGGYQSVPTGELAPACVSAAVVVDAIAGGGNYDIDSIDAGDVTFTPAVDCSAQFVCFSEDGVNCAGT